MDREQKRKQRVQQRCLKKLDKKEEKLLEERNPSLIAQKAGELTAPVREKLREKAAELGISLEGMRIAEAPDVIPMDAEPTAIMKQYKDCSMARGLQMLADGEGEAFVSAGSTGALVVGGTLIVKRIKGVKRPAIGTVVPCRNGCFMLLDSGANHDCRPEMLRQFGLMG